MYKPIIHCKICNKHITGNVWHIHVVGKKHLHYTPKKITVTGNFETSQAEEVHRYFSQFGTIGSKKVLVQDGKVAIEYCFQDRRAHSKIIYKEHKLFNEPVRISWEEVTDPLPVQIVQQMKMKNRGNLKPMPPGGKKQKRERNDSEHSKKAILHSLKGNHPFSEQVLLLQNKLQCDVVENEKKRKLIRDDLTSALSPTFGLSSIYFFGSSVTGLDMQGSDLDVYIAHVREKSRPEVGTLKVIRQLIFKCRKFCDVLLISGAKIPIIKCIHTKTQICCDLNIRNKLSVCNSQLIRYYLTLDEKMRPLMIFIKFWADCYDLKKVNFFSSYAIYMMVIFFLQQEPYNLPSVRELQRNIAPDLVEGWNCAFELKAFTSEVLKNEQMQNLVANFFRFYSKFDYHAKIITPYAGVPLDKICFLKPYALSDGFSEYIHRCQDLALNAGICIQDPFEHARCVSAAVPLSCAGKFAAMCQNTLNLIEGPPNNLLFRLLTQQPDFEYSFDIEKPEVVTMIDWKKTVQDLIVKILTEVLALTISDEMHGDNFSSFTCKGELNVFDARSNILKNLLTQLPPSISEVDREIAATKCIAKYIPSNLTVQLVLRMDFKEELGKVLFLLKGRKKCKVFVHASHFLRVKLEKFLGLQEQDKGSCEVDTDKLHFPNIIAPKMIKKGDKISPENNSNDFETGKQNQVAGETPDDRNDETSKPDEENLEIGEDEDEDIPADFFDDFSNEDFMDGLDIVDAWDEEKLLESDAGDDSKSPHRDKRHSPIRYVDKSPEKRPKKYPRSRSKSLTRRYTGPDFPRKRSRSREKLRRDPEKTRRDIDRDKIKCAKDKEQKLVNDKLRIVETGLVPPGMEMETDISTILKEKDKRRSGSSTEKPRELNRSREKRFIRKSASRETRKIVRYSPSPYRTRLREREPTYRPRKRTASMDSNISDREMWIRSSRKRTRSRSRDSSHRRSKAKKYEEKKKKTFLEEIRDKLNETRPPVVATQNYSYTNAVPHPIPAPVPAPQYFPQTPANPPMQQYDQNFFIGDGYQNRPGVMAQPGFNMMQVPHVQPVRAPAPTPPAPVLQSNLMSQTVSFLNDIAFNAKAAENKKEVEKETAENIDKLFADKKISLSDFLTITAKSEVRSSSPEHLQKKIRVISRCQDVIRSMSDDRKFSGRLSVKPTSDQKNKSDVKYQSPLRRIPVVRFMFTSPGKASEDVDSFSMALDKILQKVGVLRDTIDLSGGVELEKGTNSSFADEETASLTLKASHLNAKRLEMKSECEECKKRKGRSFADVGSQCADKKETVSIATQVNEEELNLSKGLPKNDSIAYMTPAQLLGMNKDRGKEVTPEKAEEKRPEVESPVKEKPKPPPFKARGGFRKTLRDRQPNFYQYDNFENEEFDEFYDGGRQTYEEPRENFGGRYGGPSSRPPGLMRFPRQQQYVEEEDPVHMMRVHQFRDEGNFTDFGQPYRGRGGGRFGPRF